MARHYGMDWLRIGAFALLILYHVGMVFVPWNYHVSAARTFDWAEIPMFFANPWRLSLLFVVSGFASRALWSKSRGLGTFLKDRTIRLLVPLLFGIAVIVPPQTWVELVTQHGYAQGFAPFYLGDYFRFATVAGVVTPAWNHLWFVAYLLAYTLVLASVAPGVDELQPLFERVFGGARAILLPTVYLVAMEFLLFRYHPDTQRLYDDWGAHLLYFPAFLFGFGLAGSRAVMASFARYWKPCAAVAIACFVTMAALLAVWPNFSFPSNRVADLFVFARRLETWTGIAALIGIADRYWNHDHKWRPMLTEAVFPFYIIHQTIIVVVEYWLLPLRLGAVAEFAILVGATIAGCWAFYLIGREVRPLRPLIGLRTRPRIGLKLPAASPTAIA